MKKINQKTGRRLLSFLLAVCMVLGLLPGLTMEAYAGTSTWTFGPNGGASTGPANSIYFTLDRSARVASLYKYNGSGSRINSSYCTPPYTSFYVGEDQFSYTTGWGGLSIGDGAVSYYATDASGVEQEVTSYGATSTQWRDAVIQRAEIKWEKNLTRSNQGTTATIIWNVRYVAGDSNFTHEWLISADNDVVGGLDVYYGGHHLLGGGNQEGYTYYDAVNNGIYTWGLAGNNNGLYVLRSDGATEPYSYWSGDADNTGTYISPYVSSRRALPNNTPPPATVEWVNHTCFYMHWKETGTLAANDTWKIEATEGIVSEGELAVIAPAGRIVPPGVTASYDFLVMNMTTDNVTIDLTSEIDALAQSNGWSAVVGSGNQIALNGYSDFDTVSVDITVPGTAQTNDLGETNLTAEISSVTTGTATVGASADAFVTTTVDEDVAAITDVVVRNLTRQTTDIEVVWSNHPGAHSTTIDIYDVNNVTRYTGGTATISSEGYVTGINTSMLVPGQRYRVIATVDGIEYPHNRTTFVMRGDEASGVVWRDINGDGSRATFEGVNGVDVRLEETKANSNTYEYVTTSRGRGDVGFGMDTTNAESHSHDLGGEYVIYPELDIYEYAISGLQVFADGVRQTVDIIPADGNAIFEYLDVTYNALDSNGNSTLATGYGFQPNKSAQVSLEIEVSQAAVVDVYPHTGATPDPLNYVTGGNAEVAYGAITLSSGAMSQVPYTASVAAGSSPTITYSAPHGYRHAAGNVITDSQTPNNLAAYVNRGLPYDINFPLVAGDLRLTGVSDTTGVLAAQAAITSGLSGNNNTATLEVPIVEVTTNWAGTSTQLDFGVWDSSASPVANPNRSDYTWSIVSDPSNIIQGSNIDSAAGTFTFSGTVGEARVKVVQNASPHLSHEMIIEVSAGAPTTYTSIHIAKADDAALDPVNNFALLINGTEDVVVVGVDGSGIRHKLLNTEATLVSGDGSIASATARPVSNSLYHFLLRGEDQGYTTLTATEPGGMTATTNVLVTPTTLVNAGLTITPDPVNLTSGGGSEQVFYGLLFSNNSTMPIGPELVTPTIVDTTVATISSTGNDYLDYAGDGTTTLNAFLNVSPLVTGSTGVISASGGGTVTPQGTLRLEEASGSNTGGLIEEGATAEYFAYFDVNDNGIYDGGDVLLPYGTAGTTFLSSNNRFSRAAGTLSTDNVELTGLTAGVDELTVAYLLNGTTYTASTDILVYDAGYTLQNLEVTPEITVLHVGQTQVYVVNGIFSDGSNTVSYTLPTSLYTGSIAAGGTYAALVSGSQNRVEAVSATGEATYRATLNSDNSKTADAAILVIPVGAYLSVSPDPLWIKAGNTGTVTYELLDSSNLPITVGNLTDYVSAGVGAQTIADFNTGSGFADITQVDGITAGRTTLTAYLHGQTVIETVTVYVWDDTSTGGTRGIVWNPDPLTISTGYTGLSSVYLLDVSGGLAAMVDLEHLDSLTSADATIAAIPASPLGTTLTVTGGAVTVDSNTTVDAVCPAGSAPLSVNVTTNTTVSGLAAAPKIIELWPGESKEITVTNTATGLSLDAAQLAALGQSLTDLGGTLTTENDVIVNSGGTALEVSQAGSGVATASVNLLTLTMGSGTATVYIINHTEDPYQNGYTRELELSPDPTWVELNSANSSTDVAAILTLTDASSMTVDTITLPADVVEWQPNTTATLPGRIAMSGSASVTDTVTLTGQTAGAQNYKVTYIGGTTPLTAEGSVFVFAQDITAIDFALEPAAVALRPNGTQSVRGVITYSDNSVQYITPQELPIAVQNLASNDNTTATYSSGIIRGESLGSDTVRFTYVEGTLLGTSLVGHTDVMVYDPSANMVIIPDDLLLWLPNSDPLMPDELDIETWLGGVQIPNVFLSYSALNNNVGLAPHSVQDDVYTVTGANVGTTSITSLLVNTTKSATAQAEVRDPSLPYHTVLYDANTYGTGTMPSLQLAFGTVHTVLPNGFTPDSGYYFDGWNTQNDGLGVDYDVDDPITITGDLTLYAKWTTVPPGNYTVTFDSNGGTGGMTPDHGAPGATYTVPASTFSEPANSQFKEWNTAADGSGTGYQPGDTFPLHSDVTLYAIWDDLYTVSYDATSGSGSGTGAMSPDTDVAGSTYTVRTNEFTPPANMRFVEWNTQADGLGTTYAEGATFTLTADVDLYAIWEPAPVVPDRTVSYHAASSSGTGTGMMTPDLVPDGTVYSVRGNTFTAPSGMQFREWNTAANGSGTAYAAGATMTVTADVDLYAVWEPLLPTVNHTVSYHAASSSGTGSGTMSQDVAPSGSTYTVRSSTFTAPTGMQFKEWNTAANGSGTTYAAGATFTLTVDTDLYAIWEAVPAVPEYTVSYSSNGGSGSMSADTASTGFVYTVRANGFTAPAGKRFVEWNTASDGSGTAYQPNATFALSADVTLYAIWEDLYTVAYDANGGSGTMAGHTVASGAAHRAQPSGFTAAGGSYFDGWNTAADGTGTAYSVGDPITVTANVTLYAQWTVTPPASYSVTYDGNGAIGTMPGDTDTPGATYTVQGNGYTDPSWTRFKEWNTAPDGSGTGYDPADTLTLNSDVILYAVWENIYSVTYDDNSADSGAAPTDATIYIDGETVTVSDNTGSLVKAGYVFRGWALNSAGTGQIYVPGGTYTIDGAAVSSGTVTFYAVWDDASSPSLYRLTVQAGSGGSVNSSAGGYYRVGDAVSITATPDSGYTFGSWTVTGGATLTSSGSASTTLTMAAADATATAGFSQTDSGRPGGGSGGGSSTYSITYKANGGTGSDHRVTDLASNASHTVLSRTAVDFSRSGYTFTGWNTKADGSGTSYSVGDVINVTASLTLYAQWTEAGGSDLSGILNTDDHIAYLSGYTDNTVRADNPITRAEAAAIFYRLLRNPGTASGNGFSDVQSGEWYAQAVNYLASIDILDGYNDGTFRPNASITRAEFATMASRFDNLQAGGSNVFSDVSDGHWAAQYISLAYSNGWINGYNDGTFRPDNSITRAEVVTIVNAMLNRAIDDDALAQVSNPYNDIQAGHWAYAAVIEASTVHEYERDGDGVEIWQNW